MRKDDLELICTCVACPEQYDVMYGKKRVAYVRYRWGHFTCFPCSENGDIDWDNLIYDWSSGDEWAGVLEDNEQYVLENAKAAICKYYNSAIQILKTLS